MKSLRVFVAGVGSLAVGAVQAAGIVTASFDTTFRGVLFEDQIWKGFISETIRDTVTLDFPLVGTPISDLGSAYAEYLMQVGNPGQFAGVSFSSNSMENTLTAATSALLASWGATATTINNAWNYAQVGKQYIDLWPQSQRYLTRFDAGVIKIEEVLLPPALELPGMTSLGQLYTQTRLWGDSRLPAGDVNPFVAADIPDLLLGLGEMGSFRIDYEAYLNVMSFSSDYTSWGNRTVFGIDYQGFGTLTSLKVDGVERVTPVPEPESFALILAALTFLGLSWKPRMKAVDSMVLGSVLAVASASSWAALSTTTIAGTGLNYLYQEAASFDGAPSRYNDFWSFCHLEEHACYGYDDAQIQPRSRYSGGWVVDDPAYLYTMSLNVTNVVGLVAPEFYAYPSASAEDVGAVRYNFDTSEGLLTADPFGSPLPEARALGFRMWHGFNDYMTPNREGRGHYRISSDFDESRVPAGFKARQETEILVEAYASWFEPDGTARWSRARLFREVHEGDFTREFLLSRNLYDVFPQSLASYGNHYVAVDTRLTFLRLSDVAAVPEPGSLALLGLGLGALAFASVPSSKCAQESPGRRRRTRGLRNNYGSGGSSLA